MQVLKMLLVKPFEVLWHGTAILEFSKCKGSYEKGEKKIFCFPNFHE